MWQFLIPIATAEGFGGKIDGGEVGRAVEKVTPKGYNYEFFDTSIMRQYSTYLQVKVALIVLIVLLGFVIITRLLGIGSIFGSAFAEKAVRAEKSSVESLRSRDAFVLRANKAMDAITRAVYGRGIRVSKEKLSYIQYNLERAGVRIAGGYRYMKPDEFNALCTLGMAIMMLVGVLIAAFINIILGGMIFALAIIVFSVAPMLIVRSIVAAKDEVIKNEFPDLYLMVHYELMADSGTPLARTFQSYKRIARSDEMKQFVSESINLMDTYGEFDATEHIASRYREIQDVTRLMRLIRQQGEGGDIKPELMGFRKQVIDAKRYTIGKRVDRLIMMARGSLFLLNIPLMQAILSGVLAVVGFGGTSPM